MSPGILGVVEAPPGPRVDVEELRRREYERGMEVAGELPPVSPGP